MEKATESHGGAGARCRILSLDGGGAKGFYSLGVLKELEALLEPPLCDRFDLIFGTSTGAIITALLGLGHTVDDVHDLYRTHVPDVMSQRGRRARSSALIRLADSVFGAETFEAFRTGVGIVATRWDLERPMIFKSSATLAHGRRATFTPGFGCTIAQAVVASCSAYPFFQRPVLRTGNGDEVEVMDGGYCANNPTLYAIADATRALSVAHTDIRVVSVGVGNYPAPKRARPIEWLKRFWVLQLLQKTLDVNTASMDQLRAVLFADIPTVRINDTFERPELATDLLEHDLTKLNLLRQQGAESFARHEAELKKLLETHESGDGANVDS
jgi:predicted acylesterase/phospholipase RssA